MSAIEWLHFINPLIVITMLIALIASVPVISSWRKEFKLPATPLALKKTLLVSIGLIVLGWGLAWLAPHMMTPIIRVNVIASSQVLLTVSLTASVIVISFRIFQKNNLLSLLLILSMRHFPFLARILGVVAAAFSGLLINSLDGKSQNKAKHEDANSSDEEKVLLDHALNYRGEYCDKDKTNWY